MYGQSHNKPGATNTVCAPVPQAPQDGIVSTISLQLGARLSHLHSINARLSSLADRLLGALPTANDSGGTCPQQPGDIGNLGSAIPHTDYLLEQLSAHVTRLEQL